MTLIFFENFDSEDLFFYGFFFVCVKIYEKKIIKCNTS